MVKPAEPVIFEFTVAMSEALVTLMKGLPVRLREKALIPPVEEMLLKVGAAGSLGASKNIVIEAVPPTITNITSSATNTPHGLGSVLFINVTFSEKITVTGTPLLALNSGGRSAPSQTH